MNRLLIAQVAHEINRAYCASLGDESQPIWDKAPDWQKESAMAGVDMHIANPDATPENSHESWLAQKLAEGWVYGEVKDAKKKVHPCCLPYADLAPEQKAKDYLFRAVVHALKDIEATSAAVKAAAVADREPVVAAAPAGQGFTPIVYVGKREPHIDGAYGTKIRWAAAGDTQLVPQAIAAQMLKHRDVYDLGEVAAGMVAPAVQPEKKNEDDDPIQIARESVSHMTKDALAVYAKTHFRIDLDTKQKVGDLRTHVTQLIDQYGLE